MNIITDVQTTARRFIATTSREALRLAREALGGEAMVLTNRVLADGVEIVAMAPDEVEQVLEQAAPEAPVASLAPVAPALPPAPEMPAMREQPAAPIAAPVPTPAPQPAPAPAAPPTACSANCIRCAA